MPDQAPDHQAREFAAAFRQFLDWIHSPATGEDNEVVALVRDYLGADGIQHSVVTRDLPPFEHVNLQTAINAWSARAGRTVEVHGIALPPHFGGLTAPALTDLPNGPGTTLGCLRLALLLVTDSHGRYIVLVQGPNEHQPGLDVEVAGLPVEQAQRLLAELDQLRAELNVYRGHLLEVSLSPMGGVTLTFVSPSGLTRDDVVLPDPILTRVERHALGVASHRAKLLAAGQHLKRGLLLYGPPGTGKTHTTRYLKGQMTGYTRLVLTGRSLIAVGEVTDLARALLPAVGRPALIRLFGIDLVAFANRMIDGRMPAGGDGLDHNAINQGDRMVGCVGCHTPVQRTGHSPANVGAEHLSFVWAPVFSDLLLHKMPVINAERFSPRPRDPLVFPRVSSNGIGGGNDQGNIFNTFDIVRSVADDTFSNQKASADGREFRTAPLMGLGRIGPPFLHDARVYLSKLTVGFEPAGTVTTNNKVTNAPLVIRTLDDAILATIELHDLPAPDDAQTSRQLGGGCPVPLTATNISYGPSPADVICPAYNSAVSQKNRSDSREVIRRFRALSPADQQALIEFLKQL